MKKRAFGNIFLICWNRRRPCLAWGNGRFWQFYLQVLLWVRLRKVVFMMRELCWLIIYIPEMLNRSRSSENSLPCDYFISLQLLIFFIPEKKMMAPFWVMYQVILLLWIVIPPCHVLAVPYQPQNHPCFVLLLLNLPKAGKPLPTKHRAPQKTPLAP